LHPCSPLFPYTTLFRSYCFSSHTVFNTSSCFAAFVIGCGSFSLLSLRFRLPLSFMSPCSFFWTCWSLMSHFLAFRSLFVFLLFGDRKSTRLNSSHVAIS